MENCDLASTPISPGVMLTKDLVSEIVNEAEKMKKVSCQKDVGYALGR